MNHDNKSEWNSSLAFLISMIGAAVGLGNIWRFSYGIVFGVQMQNIIFKSAPQDKTEV